MIALQEQEPNTKNTNKLLNYLIKSALTTAFESGEISEDDILKGSPLRKMAEQLSKNNTPILGVIDHRQSLLNDARENLSKGKNNNALIFYSVYFEHEINDLLTMLMMRKNIPNKSIARVMKQPLLDKTTWIIDLLGLRRPMKDFIDFIKPFSDERNAYIHYKWTYKDIDKYSLKKDYKNTLEQAERMASYLKRYRNHALYGNNKTQITKKIHELARPITNKSELSVRGPGIKTS